MPDFDTHLRLGLLAHLTLAIPASVAFALDAITIIHLSAVVSALPVTLLGAGFPDIDHPSSKPYQILRQHGPTVAALGVAILLISNHTPLIEFFGGSHPDATSGYAVGATSSLLVVLVYMGTDRLIPRLRPPHRGPTHRVPVGSLAAVTVSMALFFFCAGLSIPKPDIVSFVGAVAFLTGFISHLYGDGVLWKLETYIRFS